MVYDLRFIWHEFARKENATMRLISIRKLSSTRRALLAMAFSGFLSPALALDATPAPTSTPAAKSANVTIFAAASLKNALDEAAALWKSRTGEDISISYAASFPLARQIEAGAPADIFIAADQESMSYLADKKLLAPETRKDLLGNELVLVAPKTAAGDSVALTREGFAAALKDGRLSMGDPASVPAGKYGQAALTKLGLWDDLQGKAAFADNVRSALLFVSRGETPLGIVYATDAKAAPDVKIVARFPADSHKPIVYPIALTAAAKGEAPIKVLAFLDGPEAAKAFEKQGFVVLGGK
jgi:molybdate transport system substrate-binding protein